MSGINYCGVSCLSSVNERFMLTALHDTLSLLEFSFGSGVVFDTVPKSYFCSVDEVDDFFYDSDTSVILKSEVLDGYFVALDFDLKHLIVFKLVADDEGTFSVEVFNKSYRLYDFTSNFRLDCDFSVNFSQSVFRTCVA